MFFAVLFILSLIVAAFFHLWVGHLISEQAKHGSPDEMAERGLLFVGPSSVKVSPIEDGNEQLRVMVEVEGMAGIDARKALGWETKEDGKWLRRIENKVARWAVRKAHGVNVNVGRVELYRGFDSENLEDLNPLVVVEGMDSLHLPLSYPTKADPIPKMQSFNLQIPVSFPSPRDLVEYGQAVWSSKEYSVDAVIPQIAVSLDKRDFNLKVNGLQKRIVGLRECSSSNENSFSSDSFLVKNSTESTDSSSRSDGTRRPPFLFSIRISITDASESNCHRDGHPSFDERSSRRRRQTRSNSSSRMGNAVPPPRLDLDSSASSRRSLRHRWRTSSN